MWFFEWTFFFNLATVILAQASPYPIQLELPDSPIIVNQTFQVNVTIINPADRRGWDYRLLEDGEDVGITFEHQEAQRSGTFLIGVKIPVLGNNLALLAQIDKIPSGRSANFSSQLQDSSNTTSPVSPISSTSTMATTVYKSPVSSTSSRPMSPDGAMSESKSVMLSKKPLIIGLTIGLSLLLLGSILAFLFIRRRRRNQTPDAVVFNRELMFERRPTPYDTWTMRSVELEKGSVSLTTGDPLRVYVSRSVMSDRDSTDSH